MLSHLVIMMSVATMYLVKHTIHMIMLVLITGVRDKDIKEARHMRIETENCHMILHIKNMTFIHMLMVKAGVAREL